MPQYGVNAEVVDTNATKVTISRNVWRKGNSNPAQKKEVTTASWKVKYEFRKSTPVSSPQTLYLRASYVATSDISLTVDHSASGTKAKGEAWTEFPALRSGPKEIGHAQSPYTDPKGPLTRKRLWAMTGVIWTSHGSGSKAVVEFNMPTIGVGVTATSGGSGGNSTVASATGIGVIKFYPASFTVGSAPTGIITGNLNSPVRTLLVDLYSSSGAPLSYYAADIDSSGNYSLFPDEGSGSYRLYFSVPGSLRKRVDVTYDASTGLSGVSATLLYGDLDGDNYVSQAEAEFVAAKVGQPATDWSYGDAYDIRKADFDGDGTITSSDSAVAAANVGISGD